MYYRNCGSNMGNVPMMQGSMCPAYQNGMCPMMQKPYNSMMQNQAMPMTMSNNMEVKMEENNAGGKQLEMMYPDIYFIILPHVKHHCDKMEEKHGKMHCPDKEEMKEIIEDICKKVEKDMDEDDKKDECRDEERRPRPFGRGRLLRDLIGILLINELIGRRVPYYGYGYNYGYWY